MGKRIAALGATVLRCWIDSDREIWDSQTLILGQRHQDHIGIRRIEQGFILDHHCWTQLVRLLRQGIPPVGENNLTARKAGQWLIAVEPRRAPFLIERRRFG